MKNEFQFRVGQLTEDNYVKTWLIRNVDHETGITTDWLEVTPNEWSILIDKANKFGLRVRDYDVMTQNESVDESQFDNWSHDDCNTTH